MVQVTLTYRNKPVATNTYAAGTSIETIRGDASKATRISRDRVSLIVPGDKKARVPETLPATPEAVTYGVKDLGPQIGWATVYYIEYAGPLLVYPLVYMFMSPVQWVQHVACLCWIVHYAKREFETAFVHTFSKGTMPFFNVFKNSFYYWGFAAFVAYFVNHPLYTAPSLSQTYLGLGLFAAGELGNFICHYMLAHNRAPGERTHPIPRGFLFDFVTCPNYTCEILAWIGFSVMTQSVPALLFTLVGAAQMTQWAVGKLKRYKREHGDKWPKSRKIIIPFLY
jgi:very-long-chain enoyl-CoA reductase